MEARLVYLSRGELRLCFGRVELALQRVDHLRLLAALALALCELPLRALHLLLALLQQLLHAQHLQSTSTQCSDDPRTLAITDTPSAVAVASSFAMISHFDLLSTSSGSS